MRDAAVERLARIISERNNDGSEGNGFRPRKFLAIDFKPAEGWFSLVLVATVVYSTIWCIQAAQWVAHLEILTLTTALGLALGVASSKLRRVASLPVHILVIGFGILLAFWQTARMLYDGNTADLMHGMQHWFDTVSKGGTGEDDAIFLFLITALSFILSYTSTWLVYRMRSPWLMILANAVVLLINLNNVSEGLIIFLVVFLIASLLLLLRFNLYESVKRWQSQGLRYADDIGWDVMQAGALISVGILVLSWILPWGYADPTASLIWSANANPWVQLQNTWNRAISVQGGINPSNRGNFRDTLVLGGNPNLNDEIVFIVKTDDSGQFLQSLSYETYENNGWSAGTTTAFNIKENQFYGSGGQLRHPVKQTIKVVNAPGLQHPYLFGVPQMTNVSVKATLQQNELTGEITAWERQGGFLTPGATYSVVSSVSSADEKTLRSIPLPKDALRSLPPSFANSDQPLPVEYYNPEIVRLNTQLPAKIDPRITYLAKRITANAPTMYDKIQAIEKYLRTNYKYSVDIRRPPGEDGVAWFLFDNPEKKGFCNYFASAMTVMARSLGIPARVAVGYTNGEPDPKNAGQRIVRGKDAHAWTQVYFAGYGWINFEPSASFATFLRPDPKDYPTSGPLDSGNLASPLTPDLPGKRGGLDITDEDNATGSVSLESSERVRQQVGIALGSIVLLLLFSGIFFGVWWQRLFRRYALATQIYGRICILANWAGIKLKPAQTPSEYMQELAVIVPTEAATIERLGDIYVRERWADPQGKEHPHRSGEVNELHGLWKRLQPRLFFYVLRHPHFLRWLPERMWGFVSSFWMRRRARRLSEDEDI
jgi:hypothetical protein